MNAPHLTDDQLDELLLEIADHESTAHLAACTSCAERLAAFQNPLAAFNQACMAWSEARSNTMTRDLAAQHGAPRLPVTAAWSSAAVATLALGVAIGAHRDSAPASVIHAPMVVPAPEAVRQHEIASDNDMLAAIDDEIVTPDPGLYEPANATAPHSTPEQARD